MRIDQTSDRIAMHSPRAHLPLPPVRDTETGEPRRVGVELEMGGLDIDTLSRLVAHHVGGNVEVISRYEHVVHGDSAGDWIIELDFAYLKQKGREGRDPRAVLAGVDEAAESLVRAGAAQIVPLEVVSPPLPMDRLTDMDRLVEGLRAAGARGTTHSLVYAFGMQVNPEMPATDAATIAHYLKAFLCLFDWLKARAKVDFARRLTVYVDPFPTNYVRKVVNPEYAPDLPTLIDDYLEANPTRNRALDMLPLFAHLDEGRVRAVVDDTRIKSRPALHYRLPNCEIDRPDWGIHVAWADWLQVERLAADPDRLEALCTRYTAVLDRPIGRLLENWAEQVASWLPRPDDR